MPKSHRRIISTGRADLLVTPKNFESHPEPQSYLIYSTKMERCNTMPNQAPAGTH